MSSERARAIARRATQLDLSLEKMLEEQGELHGPATSPTASATEQRTARVERLRHSMHRLHQRKSRVSKDLLSASDRMWNEAEMLRWELAMSAWDLAEREARRIRIPEMTREDVIGEAAVGLYEAAKRFDPDLGYQFTTYARWWIRAQVKDAVGAAHRIVRLPDSARRQRARLMRSEGTLTASHNEHPSETELARATGLTSRRVSRLLRSFSSVSLHHVDNNGHSLEETISDPTVPSLDQQIGYLEDLNLLREEFLASIDGKHKRIVRARYGLGGAERQTLRELGQSMGVSSERVRQLEREALDVLRERIQRAHSPPTRAAAPRAASSREAPVASGRESSTRESGRSKVRVPHPRAQVRGR